MKKQVTYQELTPDITASADAAERLQQAAFRFPERAKGSEPTQADAWERANKIIAEVSHQPDRTLAAAMDDAAKELNRIARRHGYRKPAFRDQATRTDMHPGPPMPSDGMGRTFVWGVEDPQPLRDMQAVREFTAKANGQRPGNKVNEHAIGRWAQARRKAEQSGIPINDTGTLTAEQLALPEVADALAADLLERQRRGKKTMDPWRVSITKQSAQRRQLTNGSRHQIKQAGHVIGIAEGDNEV